VQAKSIARAPRRATTPPPEDPDYGCEGGPGTLHSEKQSNAPGELTPPGVANVVHDPTSLLPHHADLIATSRITPEVARTRGYRSVTTKADLERAGFATSQRLVPTLLIPIHGVTGELVSYQHRPDRPRVVDGKPLKYETPKGSRMVLDVPPLARPWIGDPAFPLFVTEGIRKADSAVSRGLCCLTLLGVWNWRGTNILGGATALADWESIALKGRMVYLVFDSDLSIKPDVFAALSRLKAWLESRGAIVRVVYLPPATGGTKQGLDDFFAAGGTVEGLLALASEVLRRPPDAGGGPADPGPYRVEAGRICRDKPTRDGPILEPLCNFVAQVTEEVVLDDGAEPTRAFVVTGRLDTGEPLPSVRVPASRFAGMAWVTDLWGLRAVVRAGLSTRDYLREAIQRLSPEARSRHIYTHTGWREIEGRFVYLHATGAIGASDCEVDLGPELARYSLPAAPSDPVPALRASLDLLRASIAPASLMVPLWAAAYRAPTVSALPVDVSLWLEGVTGSLKSTLAALILAHYGPFERLALPGNWSSTANQLERRAFLLKDTVFVIDDYAPGALDARELELKAARLIRAAGNRAGRGRLRADLTERPAYPPRGILIVTGEARPPGQSLLARTLMIEVDGNQINLEALGRAQAQAGQLAEAMVVYLTWLAPQMPTLPETLAAAFARVRTKAMADGPHLRVPEAIAHLYLGLDLGLACAHELGACSASEADELRERGWKTLQALSAAQGSLIVSEKPSHRFLRVLATLGTQGRAVLLDRELGDMGVPAKADLIGWQDEDALYLLPDAAWHAVTRFCRDSGEPFPLREARLREALVQEGIAQVDSGRLTTTAWVAGRSKRVLKIPRAVAEKILEEPYPAPPITTITGLTGPAS
jgi:hypothetical protein